MVNQNSSLEISQEVKKKKKKENFHKGDPFCQLMAKTNHFQCSGVKLTVTVSTRPSRFPGVALFQIPVGFVGAQCSYQAMCFGMLRDMPAALKHDFKLELFFSNNLHASCFFLSSFDKFKH